MSESRAHPDRVSGLLLHVTSLPGSLGIGDVGPSATRFLAQAAEAGQRCWQMLPIGPTGYGNSPYQSLSTFAGNVLLISPEALVEQGLVGGEQLNPLIVENPGRVDYVTAVEEKMRFLRSVAGEFRRRAEPELIDEFEQFRAENGPVWLDDFSLFIALKEAQGGKTWTAWPERLAQREPTAIAEAKAGLSTEVEIGQILQFLFFKQWAHLRGVAGGRGIVLVGDLPLYVAHDSVDVWVNREIFLLEESGRPSVVSGVPPDYFSKTGQRWGNPIYDWERMAPGGFDWWRRRVRQSLELFDLIRIDHFRGIAGYWEIPADELTAVNGRWCEGPGEALLHAIQDDLGGETPIIAEDLGVVTDDVIALRDGFGLPGMRVAQFGFDDAPDSELHHPASFPENVWAYTGTHDNNTTEGWFWEGNAGRPPWKLGRGRRALLKAVGQPVSWGLMEMVARSKARVAVFPVQDVLGLGADARMNTPGTTGGNWEWRLQEGQLTPDHLHRLRTLTEETGRIPSEPQVQRFTSGT